MSITKHALKFRRFIGSYFAVKNISPLQWKEFWNSLRPVDNGHELVRIGNSNDGGYLLPKDFEGVTCCISPGVSAIMDFEKQLLRDYGIPSILLDASIEEPNLPNGLEFRKKFLGPYANNQYVTLRDLCLELGNQGILQPYILQMDIEGFEYASLLATPTSVLEQFRTVVVEFHNVQEWKHLGYFNSVIEPLFMELRKHFDLVHLHANNCDGTFRFRGETYPRALEITFHNKDRRKKLAQPRLRSIHPLDTDNSPELPSIEFNFD